MVPALKSAICVMRSLLPGRRGIVFACMLALLAGWMLPLADANAQQGGTPKVRANFVNYEARKNGFYDVQLVNQEGSALAPHNFIPGFHSSDGTGTPEYVLNGRTLRIDDGQVVRNQAFQALCPDGSLTERIVRCIQVIIKESVKTILEEFSLALNGYVMAAIILAVTLFGVSIIAGTCRNPGSEAFMLLLKVGGVLLFTGNFLPFIDDLFGTMETLADISTSYLTDGSSASDFINSCTSDSDEFGTGIWAKIDCILMRLFVGDHDLGLGMGLLWILGTVVFWTSFMGPFVFLLMLVAFAFVALMVIRCVFTFLQCYAILALVVIVSPIFIPLILFKRTEQNFTKWVRMLLTMLIQPMIMFGFLTFFFAIMDQLFFMETPYSITNYIGVGWENPRLGPLPGSQDATEILDAYEDETGHGPGSERYTTMMQNLARVQTVTGVGDIDFVEEPVFNIQFFDHTDDEGGTVVGEIINAGEEVIDWAASKIQERISPFTVVRIQKSDKEGGSEIQYIAGIMHNLTTFFLLVIFIVYLLMDFAADLPQFVARIGGVQIRGVSPVMPVERQLKGVVHAVKSGGQKAISGAVKGLVKGGPKGAAAGAVKGFAKGAMQGYQRGAGKSLVGNNPLVKIAGKVAAKTPKGAAAKGVIKAAQMAAKQAGKQPRK